MCLAIWRIVRDLIGQLRVRLVRNEGSPNRRDCVIETRYGNPKGRENNQAPGIALDNLDTIRCECRLQDGCQARAIGVAFDRKMIPAARDNDGALTKTI